MKTFIIDGNNFTDLEGFYIEIDRLMTKNLNFKTGHNYSAFNDILCGGFGVHELNESIIIKWINYEKSKNHLGEKVILTILEIMLDCNNSGHDIKVELY